MVNRKLYDLEDCDAVLWQLEEQLNDDGEKWVEEETQKQSEFPREPTYDGEEGVNYIPERNPYLTKYEIKEAENIYWTMLNGLMINTGFMGSGKDTWLFWLMYKLRRYFAKRVLIDIPPRELFDDATYFIWKEKPYIPFSLTILQNELNIIREERKKIIHKDITVQEAFDIWMSKVGKNYLSHSVIGLSEFWKWAKISRSNTTSVEIVGALVKEFRHYNMLIVGNTPKFEDLEYKNVQRNCTMTASCRYFLDSKLLKTNPKNPDLAKTVRAIVRYGRCTTNDGVFSVSAKPKQIDIVGFQPREWLGGDHVWNLFNSANKGTNHT